MFLSRFRAGYRVKPNPYDPLVFSLKRVSVPSDLTGRDRLRKSLSRIHVFLLSNFAQGPTVLRHGGSAQTVKFSPIDNSLLASAGDDTTIEIWDLQDNTIATTLQGHRSQINSVAFSLDGTRLASGSNDWTFRLWDVEAGAHIATLEHIAVRITHTISLTHGVI